jgi:AAA+ ATPase superfamily predicted ATPase
MATLQRGKFATLQTCKPYGYPVICGMFRTSTPALGPGFHNRKSELAVLSRAINGLMAGKPQWVAVLGPRKIGKTSLVMQATRQSITEQLKVVTLDVQDQGPVSPKVFRRLAIRVLDAVFGSELGESLERLASQPAAYRALLQQSERFASLSASLRGEALELVEGKISPERVGAWLDLPEQLAHALDLYFVVALDEFQELDGMRREINAIPLMRSRWQKHQRASYFISGSARSLLLGLVQSPQAPFFQHFKILELGPFTAEAAMELLQEESRPENPVSKEVAELAVKTLGGHPFYVQLLGEELVEHSGAPDLPALKAALQKLLFSRTGRLALYFEGEFQKLVGRSTFLATTLDALAEGPASLTAISKIIQTSSGSTVSYLERLQDAVARKETGIYELVDPTFALWLRWRRPGGTVIPMTIIGDEAEQAVSKTLSAMGFDLVYQSKGSRGAFDLLATRGSLQLGVQVKRSGLPLRFKQVEWSRMIAEGQSLKWRWIVASVSPTGGVYMLDPAKALVRRGVCLSEKAVIGNLLRWLDLQGPVR